MADQEAYSSAGSADVYDAVFAGRRDLDFWRAMAAGGEGGPILEIGCGTGRVALALARAGHVVAGLDLSAPMIARARAKLDEELEGVRERVEFHVGDMTSFDLGRRFALVVSPFGGFQHLLTVDQQLTCLGCCLRHLTPDGTLVLDVFNPSPVPTSQVDVADEEPAEVIEAVWRGGGRVRSWIDVVGYDPVQQRNDCEIVYELIAADGATTRLAESFPLRYVFRFELEHLLARCGFDVVALYGDYDRSPFTAESPCLIAVAKPAGA